MRAARRAVCFFRRHRWEEQTDPVGTVTFCVRCGKLRHAWRGVPRTGSTHQDLAYKADAAGGEGPQGG
jgi:hypothetical protein